MSLLGSVHGILSRERVAHAVIGATALAAHGVSRATADLDLLVVDERCLDDRFWSELATSGVQVQVRRGDATDPLAGVVRIFRSGEPLWKGGWGMSHDRIVPLAAVASATSHRVELTMTGDEFKEHSVDYEQEYFTTMPDLEPGKIDAGDLARLSSSIPGEPGPYIMLETRALAPGVTLVTLGSRVLRADAAGAAALAVLRYVWRDL